MIHTRYDRPMIICNIVFIILALLWFFLSGCDVSNTGLDDEQRQNESDTAGTSDTQSKPDLLGIETGTKKDTNTQVSDASTTAQDARAAIDTIHFDSGVIDPGFVCFAVGCRYPEGCCYSKISPDICILNASCSQANWEIMGCKCK